MNVIFNAQELVPAPRSFPVVYCNGIPCILGSASEKASSVGESVFALSRNGGRTAMHPAAKKTDALYEVRTGDAIVVYNATQETLRVYSYIITAVHPMSVNAAPHNFEGGF